MNIILDKDLGSLSKVLSKYSASNIKSLSYDSITPSEVKNCDALFVRSVTKIDKTLLGKSKVKFIYSLTSGDDHIDFEFLKKSKIKIFTGKGLNATAVAQYFYSVLSQLIISQKFEPFRSSVGLIGFGFIGKKIKLTLDQINFPCKIYDPYLDEAKDSLESVLKSDLISLHCSYSKNGRFPSHHLINKQTLQNFKDDQILINTSRGEVIENTLYNSSFKNQFILDVWPNEPNTDKQLFKGAFMATPHIAGKTYNSEDYFIEDAIKKFSSYFELEYKNLSNSLELIPFHLEPKIEDEILKFGLPVSLILKMYDVRRDEIEFLKFLEKIEKNFFKEFQVLRKKMKRPGFESFLLRGNFDNKTKKVLRTLGFRLEA